MELPDEITEMLELVPDSLHIIKGPGRPANGFPALAAKARTDKGHTSGDAFKALRDRRDDPSRPLSERQHAAMEYAKGVMIAAERVRQAQGRLGGGVIKDILAPAERR
jgi:hypothetical protein